MAPSRPRRSARKREAPQKFEPTEASSPTRPSKRRKTRTSTPIAPPPDPDPEIEEPSAEEDNEDDEDDGNPHEQAHQIIPYLLEAEGPVNVRTQHPITEQVVTAYAKIAGRNWQYHALDPVITIGRQGERKAGSEDAEEALPDIDLGPGKTVSREHAQISYNGDDNQWHFKQLSRNGAKVNFRNVVKQGQEAILMTGDVIEIADTEMIFMAPDVKAVVDNFFMERMRYPPEHWEKTRASQLHQDAAAAGQAQPVPVNQNTTQFQGPMHVSPYGPPGENSTTSTVRPITPTNPLLQHPYLAQTAQQMKPPGSSFGQQQQPVTIESNEQIDYSNDANKDIKPPMSYATLISQAILAGPNEKSSLANIYEWIKHHFAYYRHIDQSWQNSIRHNLSLNQAFQKAPREANEPGKGGMWFIIPEKKDEYKRQGWKMTSRGGARPSSNPSSPVPNKNKSPKRRTPPDPAGSSSFATQTPPSNRLGPPSQQSQTPLRQATNASSIPKIDPTPQLMDDNSPLPMRQSFLNNTANVSGSPPMLSSSALLEENTSSTAAYQNPFTPAPRRQEISFNAPSTSKLPSQYLLQSSPAPFWKDFGTPAPLPQTSPVKAEAGGGADIPASSSPPRDGANGSPSVTRTRPEAGLGLQPQASHVGKDQPENPPLDLMGNFPKIGDTRPTNAAH